jgi:hypothetical protein
MTKKQKAGVKQAALEFYRARRIFLKMAAWAMKNARYTREETAEWLGLKNDKEGCVDCYRNTGCMRKQLRF